MFLGVRIAIADTLIGYRWNGAQEEIISIDTTTGSTSTIAILNLDWVTTDAFTVDSINHKAYLLGQKNGESFWRLYTTDLITGGVSSLPFYGKGEGGFGFDSYKKDILIGYRWNGAQEEIISIDTTTGSTSTIAILNLDWVTTDAFTVDSINHKAYLLGQKNGESFWRLYTTDLITGGVSSLPFYGKGEGGFGFDSYTSKEWTFFVYLGADNSLSPFANGDLNEMQQVGSDSNVNVVTLVDQDGEHDTHFYKVGYGSLTETPLSEIDPTWIDEVNMSDPSTLVTSANYVIDHYPANRYCIVLWNHGDGWRKEPKKLVYRAVIEDKGNIMRMDDVGHALSDVKAHLGSKIDFLGFDACLMGMVEVAYEIRDHAKVMVGSEDLIGAEGWPYDTILEDLVNDPAMDSETFARNTVDRYAELCDGTSYWTLSALRLNMAYDLAMLIDDFADSLTSNWDEIRLARSNSQEFAFWYLPYFHEHIDIYDFCSEINTAEAQAVMGKLDDMVINERHGLGLPDSHGLAIYFPANGEDYDSEYHASPDHQIMFPVDTSWDEFLARYYGEPIPDIKANGLDDPLFVTPSESVDISISLDPGDMAGELADWWGILLSSYGNFPLFGFQCPIFELPDTSLFSSPWPMGWYIFLFGLDDTPDGAFELDWYDYVVVVSQPAGTQLENIPNFDDIVKEKMRELIGE